MPTVTFKPNDRQVYVPAGADLIEAARQAGVTIATPCGGKGTCGKCIVRILSGDIDSDSLGLLPKSTVADGYVLACKTRLLDSPVTVEVPERPDNGRGQFSDDAETSLLVRQELLPKKWNFDPLAVKWFLQVAPPQLENGLSDMDRVIRAIQREWGRTEVVYTLPVMRAAADALRTDKGRVTVTLVREENRNVVIGIEPGNETVKDYGIAVDIGTTTIAVQLVFLPMAKIVATRSDYNNQISCGLDVISRINYARRPGGLQELRGKVLNTINRLISQVCEAHGVSPQAVFNAVLSGNTTMVHLLLGLNPEYIRLDPYTPTILDPPHLKAAEVGLNIRPESWVTISPCVGSYVGGDITAGLLCTDLATETDKVSLFIDIGTNGELVLGNGDFLMTCACSAGPAFEGGGIGCGMRAAVGAVESVRVDPETGVCTYSTIGGVKPRGICGSGMIDLLAGLFLSGWLDPAGRLNTSRLSPAIQVEGRHACYMIANEDKSHDGKPVIITEQDISNIIRAKAAIYSACAMLLHQLEMSFEELATVYIAGGFGRFLDLDKAIVIGLLPDLPRDRFRYIGNSSLLGAYMALVSREFHERQLEIAQRMTYVELSTDPTYMDQYTGALFLPHTNRALFPSVQPKST